MNTIAQPSVALAPALDLTPSRAAEIPSDDWAIQTSHYGRWAYSQPYSRWVWLPDTNWGPSWVEWRQSGDDFGWAPLGPDIVVSGGYAPPIEAWHYCGASHILDVPVGTINSRLRVARVSFTAAVRKRMEAP